MSFLKISGVRKPIFVCCNGGKHATKTPRCERTLFGTSLCTPPVGTTAGLGNWSRPGGKVFLLALFRQLELVAVSLRPILGRLDRRLSGIEVLSRYLLLWQVEAGGRRWPPTSSHSSTRWEGQPGDCVSRNSYLHFADIRKGLSLCLWRRWMKRSTSGQPGSCVSRNSHLQM